MNTIIAGHKAGLTLDLLATLTNLSIDQIQKIIDNHTHTPHKNQP